MVKNNTLSFNDIAVLANISRYRNNNITEFRYRSNIATALDISEATVKRSIKTLKDIKAFDKIEKINVSGNKEFRNKYYFKVLNERFILINNKIFESKLTSNEIGFLIKAKSKCFNNGLTIKGNKEEIAKMLNVSVGKCLKLIKSLSENGFISYSTGVLKLSDKLFTDTSKKATIKAKQLKTWNEIADDILENMSESKEAEMIRYYFINKQTPVFNRLSLLKRIISGCKTVKKEEFVMVYNTLIF